MTFDPVKFKELLDAEEAASAALVKPGELLEAALSHFAELHEVFLDRKRAVDAHLSRNNTPRWEFNPPDGVREALEARARRLRR